MTTTLPGCRTDLTCPDCGSTMQLRPSRYGHFYGCTGYPECRGTHGAHPDGSPLGTPADRETKHARIEAHGAFDRLWKWAPDYYEIDENDKEGRERAVKRIQRAARNRAYAWLAHEMGIDRDACHIGSFDRATYARVQALCESTDAGAIRRW